MGRARGVTVTLTSALLWASTTAVWCGVASATTLAAGWTDHGSPLAARFDRGWEDARGAVRLNNGWLFARNDGRRLYLFIDVVDDTSDDRPQTSAPWGDFLSIAFDVDRDGRITPNVDLAFGTYPGTYRLGRQRFVGPGRFTGLEESGAELAAGFGSSPASGKRHRLWEVGIPLAEVSAAPGGKVRIGLKLHSVQPAFTTAWPADFERDFRDLLEVQLARPTGALTVARLDPSALRRVAMRPRISVRPDLDALARLSRGSVAGRPPLGSHLPTGCSLPEGEPANRLILPDGTIELRFANGATKKKPPQGAWQIYCPDGTTIPTMVPLSSQILPTLPPTLPDPAEAQWLEYHGAGLLGIIGSLVDDPAMVDAYRGTEAADWNIYQRIQERVKTIDYLLAE